MSKYALLKDALFGIAASAVKQMPLFNAKVVSIQGDSCTIQINDVEIDEVRIKATINDNANKILIVPKEGSMVIVGTLSGDFTDLCIISVDEIEKIIMAQNGLFIEVNSQTGKLTVQNQQVNLKDVFVQLTTLLKQFKVFTPVGPSGTPLPNTVLAINTFENDFKKLLN